MVSAARNPDNKRIRRVAVVVVPSVFTAVAFVVLSHFHLVGRLPLWALLGVLAVVAVVGEVSGGRVGHDTGVGVLRAALGVQVVAVTATVYLIGWGPTLTVGYVFIVSRALDEGGARVWRTTLAWTIVCMTVGQVAIALDLVPSYVPAPYVHGLAALGILGTAFVMRLLGEKTAENQRIHADLEEEIRDRTRADHELRSALSLLTATLDSTADGILVVDDAGGIAQFNTNFVEMWHIPEALLRTGEPGAALELVRDQLVRPESFIAKLEGVYATPDAESHDTLEFKDGRVFERYSRPQRVDGAAVGRVWSFRDVTARTHLQEELVHQAFHDALTGLANKALFHDRLEHAITRVERSDVGLAVLFLDLDNFKTVNDSRGHAAGDALLVQVSQVLSGSARPSDTVARLGGDEFAILMEDITEATQAVALADRILAAQRSPFALDGTEVSRTVTIGISFHEPGMSVEQLLRHADLAMYTAKERGKNRYVEFESAMQTATLERVALERDLRQALADDGLAAYFQPIFAVAGGRLAGFEALVRWPHPTRGLLAPASFLTVAEDAGLVERVDRHVLVEACRQARSWPRLPTDPGYTVSVNLSARRLLDPTLVSDVATALQGLLATNSSLVLEITESALLPDTDRAVEHLVAVRALGAKVALDDFGTGYSSLAHLGRLPIDILKIDHTFVSDLVGDGTRGGVAGAIVHLAQSLNLMTVAEGVETADQLAALRRLGCDLAQGYYLGKPLDAEATRRLVATGPRVSVPVEGGRGRATV